MKSLSNFLTEAMMDVNSTGGEVNGVEILGRNVNIDIKGNVVNVEPNGKGACVFLNGNKAKEMDLTLNLKDITSIQIDGGNVRNIRIKTNGVIVRSVEISNVAKCDTIDLSEITIDGFLFMEVCKGVKTFIGPRGQWVGSISRCVNLQTLDLSAADSIGVEKANVSHVKIVKNKALKDIKVPENSFGQHEIDMSAEDLVKGGLKNVKGVIWCAGKEAIVALNSLGPKKFDATGALKKPYSQWKYIKDGKLSVPTAQ